MKNNIALQLKEEMTSRNTILLCILAMTSAVCFSQSSWKSRTYKKGEYRNIMVLAKTSDELAQRQLEDATVQQLADSGISAISAYNHIKETDIDSEESFKKKADELQVDALLAYTFDNIKSEYRNTPSVDARIGVPVKLGIFRAFLGTNVPLAGGAKKVETVNAKATFYTRVGNEMQWSQSLNGKLNNGTEKLARDFSKKTVKNMMKDDLF